MKYFKVKLGIDKPTAAEWALMEIVEREGLEEVKSPVGRKFFRIKPNED